MFELPMKIDCHNKDIYKMCMKKLSLKKQSDGPH